MDHLRLEGPSTPFVEHTHHVVDRHKRHRGYGQQCYCTYSSSCLPLFLTFLDAIDNRLHSVLGNGNDVVLQRSGTSLAIFLFGRTTDIGIQQLTYQQGMKKHLFINVPPEERSPNTNNNATKVALQKEHINLFNGVLAKHVSAFEAKNRGPYPFDSKPQNTR